MSKGSNTDVETKDGSPRAGGGDDHGVPSPCTGVCRIDPLSGRCEGCLRTLDEIAAWRDLGKAQKLRVWRLLAERRQQRMPPTGSCEGTP